MKKEGEAEQTAAERTESAQKPQKRQDEGKRQPEEKRAAEGKRAPEKHFIYIGPSTPNGSLLRNAIFSGEREQIEASLSGVIERFPKVKNLIVPISELATANKEIGQPGKALNRYYDELVAEFRKGAEQK